jgi:hypothetical protein
MLFPIGSSALQEWQIFTLVIIADYHDENKIKDSILAAATREQLLWRSGDFMQ